MDCLLGTWMDLRYTASYRSGQRAEDVHRKGRVPAYYAFVMPILTTAETTCLRVKVHKHMVHVFNSKCKEFCLLWFYCYNV